MWQVLFFVNPATVSLALFSLLIIAGAASTFFHRGGFTRTHAKVILTVTSVAYFSVLLVGFSSLDEEDPDAPGVQWNPFYFIDDLKEQETIEESFGLFLPDGRVAFYSPAETHVDERPMGTQHVDFYVHGAPEELIVRDDRGQGAADPEERFVERHISESIEQSKEPNTHESLIIEEKVMNVLLFVPVGIISAYSFSSVTLRFIYGPLFSLSIEGTQWFVSGGNIVDTSDLAANSLGSLIGTSFASAFMIFLLHRHSRKNRSVTYK